MHQTSAASAALRSIVELIFFYIQSQQDLQRLQSSITRFFSEAQLQGQAKCLCVGVEENKGVWF